MATTWLPLTTEVRAPYLPRFFQVGVGYAGVALRGSCAAGGSAVTCGNCEHVEVVEVQGLWRCVLRASAPVGCLEPQHTPSVSHIFFFFKLWVYLFIYLFYLRLCWVFVSVRGLSLVAASGGHSSSRCAGLSLSRPLLLRSTSSRCAGSVVVTHGPSCSAACGIFPDQGSNPCPLHWQADSQPLRHQGSPQPHFKSRKYCLFFIGLRLSPQLGTLHAQHSWFC